MTEYVVLREIDTTEDYIGSRYEVAAVLKARSAKAATSKHVNGSQVQGKYAAVPSRSFRPVTVTVETKTALKFS